MSRSVLLLRAVNVGGKNTVPMARLRALLAEREVLEEVETFIASGNVLCATPPDAVAACAAVRALIHEEFGVETPVIARTHEQLRASLLAQPFAEGEKSRVHVMFLEATPVVGAIEALTPRLLPGERLALVGNDLWIDYSEAGVHATKLSKSVLDRALGVAGTARNIRTTRTLAELTA